MKAMRRTVRNNDVAAWADSFMTELAQVRTEHGKTVRPARKGS
jgi:trehalose 6-phosphate synthase